MRFSCSPLMSPRARYSSLLMDGDFQRFTYNAAISSYNQECQEDQHDKSCSCQDDEQLSEQLSIFHYKKPTHQYKDQDGEKTPEVTFLTTDSVIVEKARNTVPNRDSWYQSRLKKKAPQPKKHNPIVRQKRTERNGYKAPEQQKCLSCPFCSKVLYSSQSLGGHISKAHKGNSINKRTTERNKRSSIA